MNKLMEVRTMIHNIKHNGAIGDLVALEKEHGEIMHFINKKKARKTRASGANNNPLSLDANWGCSD